MPVFPMMAVPAAVPVVVKMASAKGERVITAREQMRTRLGEPISVEVVMRSVARTCRNCYLRIIIHVREMYFALSQQQVVETSFCWLCHSGIFLNCKSQ